MALDEMSGLKALLAAVFMLAPAGARTAALDGAKCVSIGNDIARLQCFDDAFKDAGVKTEVSEWATKDETSPVDDTKTFYASINAVSAVSSFVGSPDAVLVLRCSAGITSAFVASNVYFSDISNVTVRLDGGPPDIQTHMWDLSTTGNAIGLWQGANPMRFARSLKNGGKFAMRVQGRHSFEAVFHLGNVEPIKASLSEKCSWPAQ